MPKEWLLERRSEYREEYPNQSDDDFFEALGPGVSTPGRLWKCDICSASESSRLCCVIVRSASDCGPPVSVMFWHSRCGVRSCMGPCSALAHPVVGLASGCAGHLSVCIWIPELRLQGASRFGNAKAADQLHVPSGRSSGGLPEDAAIHIFGLAGITLGSPVQAASKRTRLVRTDQNDALLNWGATSLSELPARLAICCG